MPGRSQFQQRSDLIVWFSFSIFKYMCFFVLSLAPPPPPPSHSCPFLSILSVFISACLPVSVCLSACLHLINVSFFSLALFQRQRSGDKRHIFCGQEIQHCLDGGRGVDKTFSCLLVHREFKFCGLISAFHWALGFQTKVQCLWLNSKVTVANERSVWQLRFLANFSSNRTEALLSCFIYNVILNIMP